MSKNNSNQKLFIGLLIGILIGTIFALHGLELLPGGYRQAAAIMIAVFFLVAILFLLTTIYRDRIFQAIFGGVEDLDTFRSDAQGLTDSVAEAVSDMLTEKLPEEHQHRARKVAPRLANYLIWGRIRNWWLNWLLTIFVAIGGLATTVLLVNQNKLLETQNKKIEIQTHLMEAERRGGQVVLMNSVLQDLSNEIVDEKRRGKADSTGYSLSAPLIGRIAATSQGFLPYRFLQGDTLTEIEYSLERGQLLLAILNSRIAANSLERIFQTSDFSSSYLARARLVEVDLTRANLNGANFSKADLTNAKLLYTNLLGADFSGADLFSVNIGAASVQGTNFREANLRNAVITADLREADLRGADLYGAFLTESVLYHTNLEGANLDNAILERVNLSESNLSNSILSSANLIDAELINANLTGAYLTESDLRGADLSHANLMNARLVRANLSGAYFAGAIISLDQLLEVSKLKDATGLPNWIQTRLKYLKPCLFTEEGCFENKSE